MSATGNDFIIIDGLTTRFSGLDRRAFAQKLCRRHFSIGADGLIFIEKATSEDYDFKWDFYNSDGSHAEMCGNAARCVARFAFEKKYSRVSACFETVAGGIKAEIKGPGLIEVEMPRAVVINREVKVPVGEHLRVQVSYLNTGVPHVVKENDDWDDEYLTGMGRHLREHAKANATFYEVTGPNSIQAATFERGVEDVTLSCGTGAVAAAAVAFLNGMKSSIQVHMPGGELTVALNQDLSRITLTGEAHFICNGIISEEALG